MVIPYRRRRQRALAVLFLAPAAILCMAPIAYALGLELWFSLSDAAPGTDGRFIGLANFQALAGLDGFWQMLQNTAVYTVSGTLLKLAFGLAMALALVRPFRGRRLVYAALFLPFIFPVVLGTIAWYFLFSNVHGALDWLLLQAHLETQPVDWKGRFPLLSVVIVNVWHGSALFGVLLLAAMRSVPTDLLDAAAVDGAGRTRRFLHIVVPYLRPAAILGCLLSVLGNFGDFATVELLTRGGPLGRSQIVSTYAFENALLSGAIGFGAAVALVMIPVYVGALLVALRLVRD
ncbi:MAG TPA: sugar ABC transporter permease [Candidatus Dormibacteraeota bacterium]|jgi:ABC-type sugar transport system permease subunit